MDKEPSLNIKIRAIALIVVFATLFGLYKYQLAPIKAQGNGESNTYSVKCQVKLCGR